MRRPSARSARRDLSGDRGVFFYTPLYEDLRASVEQYITSLGDMVEITIPPEHAESRPIEIEVGDTSVEIE